MDELFALPRLNASPGADGWAEEHTVYRLTPRAKPKFGGPLNANSIFGGGDKHAKVKTRVRTQPVSGEVAIELSVSTVLESSVSVEDRYQAAWQGGLRSKRLERVIGDSRREEVAFDRGPFGLPPVTYPEVLIPFLMRGQPRDGKRRALYAWTADRFCARVYYESRGATTLDVPAGRIRCTEVWMYPDLNDWIALGGVITKLAKPLLPRYDMWFEDAPPHRVVRFEGPYGPPGAPEIVLELT